MQAERDAHGPIQTSLEMARVLGVAEQTVVEDLDSEFLECHPMDSIGQRLSVAHRPTRNVPEAGTGTRLATGEENPIRGDDDELNG